MCFTCNDVSSFVKLLASFVSLKVILSFDYLYICFWYRYRCRTFQDGGESNREFIKYHFICKISVIFNARSQSRTLSRSEKNSVYDFDIAITQSDH